MNARQTVIGAAIVEEVKIIQLTQENVDQVVAPLSDWHEQFHERLKKELTAEDAKWIREQRITLNHTWGQIGRLWEYAHDDWDGGQILGRALCYHAATLLGEDPHDKPWN